MKLEIVSYVNRNYCDVYEYKKNALANCHAKGVYSIVLRKFDDGKLLRMFFASRHHDLWKNDFQAFASRQQPLGVAIHSHHCDIQIHGLMGTVRNIRCRIEKKHTYKKQNNLKAFRYTSSITNGTKNGKFVLEGTERIVIKDVENIHSSTSVAMRANELHTVYVDKGHEAAWLVLEGKEDKHYNSLCYSDDDLTTFPFEQYYQPVDELKVAEILFYSRLLPDSIDYNASKGAYPERFCIGESAATYTGSPRIHFIKNIDKKYRHHREDGPALVQLGVHGQIINHQYYIDNVMMTKEQYYNHPVILSKKLQEILAT